MKKTTTIENKFRNNEPLRSSRNIRRKIKTDNVSFTEKVTEKLKSEVKKKEPLLTNRTLDNVILKVGDYCEYVHGNNEFKCIIHITAINQKYELWSGHIADVSGIIVDNLNSPYYYDNNHINMQSYKFKYLENYIPPEITKIAITKDSLKNMKFFNYNKFSIEDFLLDYSYITTIKDSQISCGVKQYSVINDLFNYERFRSMFSKKYHEFTFKINKNDFYKIFCKSVLENIFKTYTKAGFLIISTNETRNTVFKHIDYLLTNYDFISHKDTINPNTNNNIRFWTCDLFSYRKSLSEKDKNTIYVSQYSKPVDFVEASATIENVISNAEF